MGLIIESFKALAQLSQQTTRQPAVSFTAGAQSGYQQFARDGYAGNEVVFKAIDVRATSCAEPHIIGLRRTRIGPSEEIRSHPVLSLLNNPNPYTTRSGLWSTVCMDRDIAGNAYLLKLRGERYTNVAELWRLRPDRVQVIPVNRYDPTLGVEGYLYREGPVNIVLPAADVLHFKTRNALDDWYGMPPLMPLMGRVGIDNFMRDFVRSFFQNAGVPAGILTSKQRLSQDAKDQIRQRFRNQFGGPAGWHELLILETAEAAYTPMTMQLGQRGLVVPELSAISEAHIAMVFGVPASILGVLVGLESSSYANKRADWQVFWDVEMTPLFRDLADVLTLGLLPDFPSGIDELAFDLSDIRALQEDVDALRDRYRKDVLAGLMTVEEFYIVTGREPPSEGTLLIPASHIATPIEELGKAPEQEERSEIRGPLESDRIALPDASSAISEVRCPSCDKLAGKNLLPGSEAYCRKCKASFPVVEVMI